MTTQGQATAPSGSGAGPLLRPGDVVGERYEIVRLIGEGGMGSVFEARHRILGRPVAIKVLKPEIARDPQLSARFLVEAKAAAELHHRNIVELTDYGVDGDRPYMVMELLRGESLAALLKREGQLAPSRAVAVVDPVLRALAMAHERGVVHRDIKPENIFLVNDEDGGDPLPKIVDFGIAKRHDESVQLTSANMALGTPAYMAPEQIMSSRSVTGAADQYAVGVTLYECLTGRNPYDAETLNAFIVAKATQDPAPLGELRPDLDPRLVGVVMRTLARKPEDRFPTIAALREALAPFRGASSLRPPSGDHSQPAIRVPAPTPTPTPAATSLPPATPLPVASTPHSLEVPAPRPEASRSPWLGLAVGALVVVGLAVAGAVALSGRQGGTTQPPPEQPPPPPAEQQVTFAVEVEPRAATIRLDGEVIGTGRAAVVRPRDGRRHQLSIEAPGYSPVTEVLAADADVRIERQLARVEAPAQHDAQAPQPRGQTPTPPQRNAPHAAPDAAAAPQTAPPPQTPPQTPPPTQNPTPRRHDPNHPQVDPTNPFDNT